MEQLNNTPVQQAMSARGFAVGSIGALVMLAVIIAVCVLTGCSTCQPCRHGDVSISADTCLRQLPKAAKLY